MPVIAFASPKGGAGKSTSTVLLSTALALRGAPCTIVDADPNHPVSRWAKRPGRPDNLNVVSTSSEEDLVDAIDAASSQRPFVVIDLEGTASSAVGVAMSRADLVVIPTKGSDLDAAEAVKAIKFLRFQERNYRRKIPFAVLFTQTSPAIRPRTQVNIETELREQGVPVFATQVHERDAYRAIFTYGGTLDTLDTGQVRNIEAAKANARALANEVIETLDRLSAEQKAVA